MRGKVEVFAVHSNGSEELLLSEPNLVVNGAGESIVDMLTTPSSVLGVDPHVMDTSNWRFGAISFGPAAGSFSGNAYFFPEDQIYMKEDDLCNGVSANVSSIITQISKDKQLRILWVSSTIGDPSVKSYTPPYRLPSYPDPLNQKLEDASTSYSIVSGDGTQSFGQFENRICFAKNDASSYFQGAYPTNDIDRELSGMLVSSYEGDFQADASANMIVYKEAKSGYNARYNIDYRGFITTKYNDTEPSIYGNVHVSGSTLNDVTGTLSQCSKPTVTISTKIPASDVWALNMYGGIHQIGLWNMDTPKALKSNPAPLMEGSYFIDIATGITPQEYKLFAKKTFTNNLATIQDFGQSAGFQNHQILKIQWTLDLRSQHD